MRWRRDKQNGQSKYGKLLKSISSEIVIFGVVFPHHLSTCSIPTSKKMQKHQDPTKEEFYLSSIHCQVSRRNSLTINLVFCFFLFKVCSNRNYFFCIYHVCFTQPRFSAFAKDRASANAVLCDAGTSVNSKM